ncbi:MAG: hypothetical protein B7Z66_03260 [Chromatiales bacterium 21-64-14]|nr:MAG: hypothetical protein B7Z66_03260 [Chromatiales bacterium 21-64-14]HQU15843.1 peptidoglycan-binding domain-containing protein [Gammaproteobacteria bacterium]
MKRFTRQVAIVGAAALFGLATVLPAMAADTTTGAPANPSAAAEAPAVKHTPTAVHHKASHVHAHKAMHKHPMVNARVKEAQEALNKDGYKMKADGIMGKKTRAALKEFQAKHGLKATGQLNSATLKKLHGG